MFTSGRANLARAIVFITLIAIASILGADGSTVNAQSATPPANDVVAPQFVIYPADSADGDFFQVELESGESTTLEVVLGSADDEPLDLISYAADVVPAPNGGFAVAREDVTPTGLATWLDYPLKSYHFEPGEGARKEFQVSVPENAPPGQYIAGLVLQTAEPREVEGTDLFRQTIRKIVQVVVVVPGSVEPSFELGEPEHVWEAGLGYLQVDVQNTGNVLVRPAGNLLLTDATGRQVLTAPVEMGSVYMGLTSPLMVFPSVPVPAGEYFLSVDLVDSQTGTEASIENQPIIITGDEQGLKQLVVAAEVSAQPEAADPVYLEVDATITNNDEAVTSSEVVLDVTKDGELVESFTLASSLALPAGDTEISQRYIPPAGFDSGEWTFVIRLNVVDPSTGSATTVATLDDIPPIVVP